MGALVQDVRYALRAFARTPGFTVAAALSLALGVGANTAIFSVASALLMRPLPYQDPERLVILWNRSPGLGITEDWFSTAQYFDIKEGHRGFEHLAIAIGGNDNLTGHGEPERIGTVRVSSNLLPMLGARAAVGRLFVADEDLEGAAGSAVLSHGTWLRRYGGDPRVVGTSLTINGQAYEVVGVLPSSFSLPREVMPTLGGAEAAEILLPLPLAAAASTIRTREDYNIVGKLRAGVTIEQAQAEMDTITARLRRDHPEVYPPNSGLTFAIVPLREQVVGDVRRSVLVLMGAVACVLLIACANIANLLLSRSLGRQKEMAVRAALGASRARVVQQLVTESIVLALVGGALGLLLAFIGVNALQALGPSSVPRLREVAINRDVFLFALAVSLCSGALFGIAPALRISGEGAHEHLKDGSRGASGMGAIWSRGRGHSLRKLLVVSELALSVVLLIGAGLLVRSLAQLQQVPPGFEPSNVLTLELTMSGRKYGEIQAVLETYRQLWPRLRRLPGVTAAGGVSALPLSQMFAWGPVTVEGRTPPPGEHFINADVRIVSDDYFGAMQIPLIDGRLFNEHDIGTSVRVAVVDAHMAQQLWPGGSPVGKRLRTGGLDSTSPWLTVVGVVGRVKQYTLDGDSRIAMYLAHEQYPRRGMNVVLKSAVDPAALTAAVQQQIRELDPDLPVYRVLTMAARVDESLARRRFSTSLLTVFAALALGLAAVGVYGVVAYLVSQGTRELGIRLALGATPRGLLAMTLRQGMVLAVAGVGAGVLAAFVLTRFMRGLLFAVGTADPLTFTVIPLLLAVVAGVAIYVPARRAARIDPSVALRTE